MVVLNPAHVHVELPRNKHAVLRGGDVLFRGAEVGVVTVGLKKTIRMYGGRLSGT